MRLFELLVQNEGDADKSARQLAGDSDHADRVFQELKGYHKNLLKPLVDFEDADVAVRDAHSSASAMC